VSDNGTDDDPQLGVRAQRTAELLLRLPFAEPMEVFERVEDVDLLARPGRARRSELARLTGADEDRTWVLLSFTALDWGPEAVRRVEALDGYAFFGVRPLKVGSSRIHVLDRETMPFSDVLASCDVVLSKPGFGILSECVANAKPLVYAEREDFIEYPVLVRAIERYLRHVHLPAERLYRGDLGEALDAAPSAPPAPERLAGGGAEQAARRMAAWYRGGGNAEG
jgi:L-arabinokinase